MPSPTTFDQRDASTTEIQNYASTNYVSVLGGGANDGPGQETSPVLRHFSELLLPCLEEYFDVFSKKGFTPGCRVSGVGGRGVPSVFAFLPGTRR